jgi:ribonuclease HII
MPLKPFLQDGRLEAGCDEAGRGCLAGPVYAAAVILPAAPVLPELNDSKQLSGRKREEMRAQIEERALAWAVACVEPKEIDEINILRASFLAMHRALQQLDPQPEFVLVDGNRFVPYEKTPFQCVVKGDATYASIAAASILAKTYRDQKMKELGEVFPQYLWHKNKGYPTREHRQAIRKYGPNIHHRQSYKLLPEDRQGKLF